ncbi:MAG: hypothetical protein AAF629_04155 [Chloroflexota bacterium]
MTTSEKIDYLSPDVPETLSWFEVPLFKATNENLKGYGQLVDDFTIFR